VSRITNTVELDEEADKSDEIVWDSYIVWTGFALAWPNDAEK
jgi:hypothetical protein